MAETKVKNSYSLSESDKQHIEPFIIEDYFSVVKHEEKHNECQSQFYRCHLHVKFNKNETILESNKNKRTVYRSQ